MRAAVIDRLTLKANLEYPREYIGTMLSRSFILSSIAETRYHSEITGVYVKHEYDFQQKLIACIHQGPKGFCKCPLKLDIYPSKTMGVVEVDNLVESIDKDTELFKVSRIDHCVDISVPIQEVHKVMYVPRKRVYEKYRAANEIETVNFGSWPEQVTLYNKGKKEKLGQTVTRIEVRQTKAKTPIASYAELENLKTYDPFQKIEFNNCINDGSEKGHILTELISAVGLKQAASLLNKHNNFKRDCGELFRPVDIPNLKALYQKNIKNYFNGVKYDIRKAVNC